MYMCIYHKVLPYFVYRDGHGLGSMAIHLAHHCIYTLLLVTECMDNWWISMCVCSLFNEGAMGGEGEENKKKLSLQSPAQLEYPQTSVIGLKLHIHCMYV